MKMEEFLVGFGDNGRSWIECEACMVFSVWILCMGFLCGIFCCGLFLFSMRVLLTYRGEMEGKRRGS